MISTVITNTLRHIELHGDTVLDDLADMPDDDITFNEEECAGYITPAARGRATRCAELGNHLVFLERDGRKLFFCSSTHCVSYLSVHFGKQGKRDKGKEKETSKDAESGGTSTQ